MLSIIGSIFPFFFTYLISAYFFDDISMSLGDTEWGSMWIYLKWGSIHVCWVVFWLSWSAFFSAQSVKMSMKDINELREKSPKFTKD